MKLIIYTMQDGRILLGKFMQENGQLSDGIRNFMKDLNLSVSEAVKYAVERSKPKGLESWRLADSTVLPGGKDDGSYDRTFDGAFVNGEDNKIVVDMDKAKELCRDYIRELRKSILIDLDTDYIIAHEKEDVQLIQSVKDKKQILRDLPHHPDIEAATNPQALKDFMSSALEV